MMLLVCSEVERLSRKSFRVCFCMSIKYSAVYREDGEGGKGRKGKDKKSKSKDDGASADKKGGGKCILL